jgi:hypothetical protein
MPRRTGRFYPNLTGQIPADAEQSIYRLFDDVYQLRTEINRMEEEAEKPMGLEEIRSQLESTGSHPINIVNLIGGNGGDTTPHTVLLWEELQSPNLQVWLSPANILVPAGEAKVIVGADLPVGVNGALIPDYTASGGGMFRSNGAAFNLGVFNTIGNTGSAQFDVKFRNAYIAAASSGNGGTLGTQNMTLWTADHIGTDPIGFVRFQSVANPGSISLGVLNVAAGIGSGANLFVANGVASWEFKLNGGTSQILSSLSINGGTPTGTVMSFSGATGQCTIHFNLAVLGDVVGSSSVGNIQYNFTGALISDGSSNFAANMFLDATLTGFAGDTAFLTGQGLNASLTTQGGAEVIASISQLRLVEPNITLVGGSTATIAATLHVVNAPTEGVANYSIKVDTGLTSTFDFEHTGTLLGFYGTAPIVQSAAYTVTNHTDDRIYDANASSVAELADVLGSLILDLINYGVLQGSVT